MPAHKVLVLDCRGPKAGAAVVRVVPIVATRDVVSKLDDNDDDDEKDTPHGLENKSIVGLLRAVESTALPTKGDIALGRSSLVKNEGSAAAQQRSSRDCKMRVSRGEFGCSKLVEAESLS